MTSALNAERRARDLEALAGGEEVDLAVIGGGITGTGVALDAASRGLSVALLERRDLANGTSRWSSKLAHGGLRYLAQGEFDVAWESARERAILMRRLAPHLVRPLPLLVPLGDTLPFPQGLLTGFGLRIGDAMRALSGTSRRRLPPPRRVSTLEACRLAPALRVEGLRGALLMWDGQLEDDARLVVAVARTAAAYGTRVCTYTSADEVERGRIAATDQRTGERLEIRARNVINATGVWAGELTDQIRLRPSRGSHIIVASERLGWPRAACNIPVGRSGRWVFAVPASDGRTIIGITDEPHRGEIPDAPGVTDAEERFLLETINSALDIELRPADVIGRYAGLRPLLEGAADQTADLSRRHAVVGDPATGMVTVVGGKLTTFRAMAEDAVDVIAARPGVDAGPSRTARLSLVGAGRPRTLRSLEEPERLVRRYGVEAPAVAALAHHDPALAGPIADGLPVLGVEMRFAVTHELALDAEDLVDRRTRLGLVDAERPAALRAAGEFVALPAPESLAA
ncbi:MAG: glycerol-3-phosphate dehydrogenase/oxidase [Solirubrobacterales bacterium]